jgi:hypothetical protein
VISGINANDPGTIEAGLTEVRQANALLATVRQEIPGS